MKSAWWKESVVYQIYPRSFMDSNGDGIGDLNGITEKLDYLKELGVDVIWLSPVYQSPNDDNGYDISNYQEIMEEFGTMEDYDRMLSEAHKRKLKVVMDLVVNHTSSEHPWFLESRKFKQNKYHDYYMWQEPVGGREPNNWGSWFGGSAWEYEKNLDMYYLHLFSKKQPDLNWDNPAVREEIYTMMDWWCKKGIDGFRMDVINLISKDGTYPDGIVKNGLYSDFSPFVINGPHVHQYLQEMNQKVLSRYDLMTVGECADMTPEEARKYASSDGKELNMIFQFESTNLDFEKSCKWIHKKMDLTEWKASISKWQTELKGSAWSSLFWCNHDYPRIVSRICEDLENHRETAAKMLGTCIHMMQGTPYIYQGEELGMTNAPFRTIEDFRDIESIQVYEEYTEKGIFNQETMFDYIKYKSRDNARTPMQWNNQQNAGFTKGTPWIMVNPNYREINAEEQKNREDSVYRYYQKLITLRKQYPIIVHGDYQLLCPEHKTIYAYTRTNQTQTLLVLCSFSKEPQTLQLNTNQWQTSKTSPPKTLLSNYPPTKTETPKEQTTLRPYQAIVYLYDQ